MIFNDDLLKKKLLDAEPILFAILCLLTLIPIWSVFAYLTLDGQGHIYNGQLLWSLVNGQSPFVDNYAEINQNFSPNWISQPIIAFLTRFFTPFTTEKIIISLYVLLFVFSWRKFVFAFFPENAIASLTAFIFVWSSSVNNGFFNYNFGVALLFLNLSLLKKFSQSQKLSNTMKLGFGMLLLYFSHLIPFCVFGLAALSFIVSDIAIRSKETEKSVFAFRKTWFKIFLTSFVPILLLSWHLFDMPHGGPSNVVHSDNTTERLMHLSGYNCMSDREWSYSRWLYFLIIPAAVLSLFRPFRKSGTDQEPTKTISTVTIVSWLILLIICTYALPDGTGLGGGMLTVRLIYLSTTVFFILLLTRIKNYVLLSLVLAALLIVQIDKQIFIHQRLEEIQAYCKVVDRARGVMDHPGLMYTADFKRRWPLSHCTDILGFHIDILIPGTWLHKSFNSIRWKDRLPLKPENMPWLDNEGKCNTDHLEQLLGTRVEWYIITGNPEADRLDSAHWTACREMLEQNYTLRFEAEDTLAIYELRHH